MRTIRTIVGCCVAIAIALPSSSAIADEPGINDEAEGIAQVGLFRHHKSCHDGCDDNCDVSCDASCDGCGHDCHLFDGHRLDWLKGHCGEGHCKIRRCRRCKDCPHCRGGNGYGNGDGTCRNCRGGLFGHGGQTYAPGHGYVMPTKRPMWDVSYPYNYMLNATSMGVANGQRSSSPYGNVYMPTDTTQLGYSYGHVPYWMPRAGMVPPIPNPEAYHLRVCLPGYPHGCQKCQHQHYYNNGGVVYESGTTTTTKEKAETKSALKEVAAEPTLAPIPEMF